MDSENLNKWFNEFCVSFQKNEKKWNEKLKEIEIESKKESWNKMKIFELDTFLENNPKKKSEIPYGLQFERIIQLLKKNNFRKKISRENHFLNDCVIMLEVIYATASDPSFCPIPIIPIIGFRFCLLSPIKQ